MRTGPPALDAEAGVDVIAAIALFIGALADLGPLWLGENAPDTPATPAATAHATGIAIRKRLMTHATFHVVDLLHFIVANLRWRVGDRLAIRLWSQWCRALGQERCPKGRRQTESCRLWMLGCRAGPRRSGGLWSVVW